MSKQDAGINQVYAFQNLKEEVMKSSSGGAFIALCRAFENIHKGNAVFYGAAFDDKLNVVHRYAESVNECKAFQGSKYVKSNCNIQELKIKEQIRKGKYILFSGTPCQIYALNQYIKRHELPRHMFLTVDVICHGTPKTEFWDAYKSWLEQKYGSRMTKYSFRYKPEGWKAYPAFAAFENGKILINTAETSVFSHVQMAGLSIAKGCFSCPFANERRFSDITLGDYWGIEHVFSNLHYKKGVSLVLVHSQEAVALIDEMCKSQNTFCIKTTDKSYLKYQHNLNNPTQCPENYERFWNDFSKLSFEELIIKYIGYGYKYKIIYQIKKAIRKTPLIEWYRDGRRK